MKKKEFLVDVCGVKSWLFPLLFVVWTGFLTYGVFSFSGVDESY